MAYEESNTIGECPGFSASRPCQYQKWAFAVCGGLQLLLIERLLQQFQKSGPHSSPTLPSETTEGRAFPVSHIARDTGVA